MVTTILLGLGGLYRWDHPCLLSALELRRVAGFPDAFKIAVDSETTLTGYRTVTERLGNAVTPPLMEAIAAHVAATFLGAPAARPARPLDFIDKPINPPGPYLFNVVSLFAGCGGSSLGYKWAGGKVLAAVEWDHNAAETYRLNHHGTPVLERDIKTVLPEELLALTGLQPGELDILDGSPPCQGFSTAGKRNFYDDRNDLFAEYVRLLRGLQPRVFVMENVSGMVKGHMKHIFSRIMRELKASGYTVKAQLMNAMYFGVPQSRERVIIIGVREDVGVMPPRPSGQTRPLTVREAWRGLSVEPDGLTLTPLYARYWHRAGPGGVVGRLHSMKRLRYDAPSFTMVKSEGNGGLYHPAACRMLHQREFMRLCSFPDAFHFVGGRKDWQARMGNTVPPRFMQAIAEHVRDQVLAPVLALELAGQAPDAR